MVRTQRTADFIIRGHETRDAWRANRRQGARISSPGLPGTGVPRLLAHEPRGQLVAGRGAPDSGSGERDNAVLLLTSRPEKSPCGDRDSPRTQEYVN